MDRAQIEDFVSKCAEDTIFKVVHKGFLGRTEQTIGCQVRLHDDEWDFSMKISDKLLVLLEFDRIISIEILPALEFEALLRICEGIIGKDLAACRLSAILKVISLLNSLLESPRG